MVDAAAIAQLREAFEGELSRAASVKDLQTVRDRYLGRKNGLVPAPALGAELPIWRAWPT